MLFTYGQKISPSSVDKSSDMGAAMFDLFYRYVNKPRSARYTRLSERERKTKNRDELLKQRILEEEEVKETAGILLDLSQLSLKVKSQSTLTDPDPLLCQNLQLKRENRQLLKEIQLLQEEKNQLKEKLSHTSTDATWQQMLQS